MATIFPIHLNYPENLSLAILPPEYASAVVDQIDQASKSMFLERTSVFKRIEDVIRDNFYVKSNLKEKFEMGHGHANALVAVFRKKNGL